ncbi:MAG: hypothetical protein ACYDHU_11435 [Acidimicrobiales bacterium]
MITTSGQIPGNDRRGRRRHRGPARLWTAVACGMVVAVLATLVGVASSPARPSGAAGAGTALSCWSTSPALGGVSTSEVLAASVTGAPSESLPGATFTIPVSFAPSSVPTVFQGDAVTSESAISVVIPVPAGATFVSASLSGGSGIGATVTERADPKSPSGVDVVESVPGPISAGQSFTLPTIELTVQATRTLGTTIAPALLDVPPVTGSQASTDPVLSDQLQVTVAGTPSTVTTGCWPTSPPPAFSSTTVVAVDTIPPVVTVTTPTEGAVYGKGQVVDASYGCTDVASYGVATCAGPVPSGSPIDTATTGEHTFTVTATDTRGDPAEVEVSYYVTTTQGRNQDGPTTTGTLPLVAGTSCTFGGSGCPSPTPPDVTYQVVSPLPVGGTLAVGQTFTVEWQVYKPGTYSASPVNGPLLYWTLPAPTDTVIDGPVTTSATGLATTSFGTGSLTGAGACKTATCATRSAPPGISTVNGVTESGTSWTYDAVNLTSLKSAWNEYSTAKVGTDGTYMDLTYTAKVVKPGPVTLPGFPAVTTPFGRKTAAVPAPTPAVSFTAVDPDPPTISVTSPANGAAYTYGQTVDASFTCADPFVAVTSCTAQNSATDLPGTTTTKAVADGAPIDTTSPGNNGIHTFIVTAIDADGNTATQLVAYTVVSTPPVANAVPTYSVAYTPGGGNAVTLHVLSVDTIGAPGADPYPLDPASVTVVSPPSYGTATANTNGTITYTTGKTIVLVTTFTFTVADIAGDPSNPVTVTVDIVPPLVTTGTGAAPSGLAITQPSDLPTDVLYAGSGGTCGSSKLVLDGEAEVACGRITPVLVTDTATGGWTVTGQVSDFITPTAPSFLTCDTPSTYSNQCIPGGDLGWAPTQPQTVKAADTGAAAVVEAGGSIAPPTALRPSAANTSPILLPTATQPTSVTDAATSGLHATPQLLCSARTGTSGGSFSCGAGLELVVPASAAASGTGYRALLTLTLS